jgi:AcrR family transcriptional regulator
MSRGPTETKSQILLSARSLFSSHGFTATSLDDILDATGITKGAFYHYFHSKEDLCQQVLQNVVTEYQELVETIDKHRPAAEQLKQWIAILIGKNKSGQWGNCRLITRLSVQIQQLGPELQSRLMDFWRWYEGLYENWLTGCGFSAEQAKLSAQTLLSTIFGAIWLEKSSPGSLSSMDIVENQLRLILQAT